MFNTSESTDVLNIVKSNYCSYIIKIFYIWLQFLYIYVELVAKNLPVYFSGCNWKILEVILGFSINIQN